ncbi:hypothetical protein BZL30_9336 [Mycobacterium kansasii]|uniref:Uncharacterized protein n=1 Tax=Mycobacterium kansasii TaxID=1768 RepID=A0A1V3WAP8_MYCKA|nr:hypothetical protein BZL30_9336 [Mycobacterium kansasii]
MALSGYLMVATLTNADAPRHRLTPAPAHPRFRHRAGPVVNVARDPTTSFPPQLHPHARTDGQAAGPVVGRQ